MGSAPTGMSRRTGFLLAGAIVVGALALAVLLVSLAPEPEQGEPPSQIPFVATVPVMPGSGAIPVRGAGIVRPSAQVDLAPQVGGRVVWVDPEFRSGRRVAEGQVLFRIDEADYLSRVREAEAAHATLRVALLEAEEAAEIARDEYARFLAGQPDSADAPNPLAVREPQLEAARAALQREEARLALANLELSRTRVKSPFDGIVREESVDFGQLVTADQAIGKIFSTDSVEVVVPLSDTDAALIPGLWDTESGGGAERAVASVAATYGDARISWPGFVDRAESSLDEETRTIEVIVRVPDPFATDGQAAHPPLLVGKFAEVTIDGVAPDAYFRIRRSALQPGNEVWSVRRSGTVRIVPVRVLQRVDDAAFVTGELDAAEPVIVGGIRFASDGMAVRVEDRRSSSTQIPSPAQ